MWDFPTHSMGLNALLFAAAASVIWYAGSKMERQADEIASRMAMGHAFVGTLFLGGATSLPEITTTVTAIRLGNLSMAVHNLLGSVVFNTAALAIADAASGRSALTHRSPSYVLIMLGSGVVLLLTLVLLVGAVARGGVEGQPMVEWLQRSRLGEGSIVIGYLGLLYATHRGQDRPRWKPTPSHQANHQVPERPAVEARADHQSAGALYGTFAVTTLIVLGSAWMLTQTGNALAIQTGLSGGFVGFALIALATTLPEISTTVVAARSGNENMAIANVFGSSAFVLMVLGVTGLFVGGDVLLLAATPSATFAAALGMIVTLTYLWGLLEHADRTALRMGWDSLAVVVFVLGGSWVIYVLE